jgi:hypothetical protein
LPASSFSTDRAGIFNRNIQELYSTLGTADDLDRIVGTAELDTLYIAAAQKLNLIQHYNLNDEGALYKAAAKLKKRSKIAKSEYGELKIKVWDKNADVAATLATTLFQLLDELHRNIQNKSNSLLLQRIKQQYLILQQSLKADTALDKLRTEQEDVLQTSRTAKLEQLQEYEKLLNEYQFIANANSPVLFIVENARPNTVPDKPKIVQTLVVVFFAALVFSFLLYLFVESRKATL